MADYKSIAERLRRYWYKGDRDDDQREPLGLLVDEMHDAADAITELLAENDKLRERLSKWRDIAKAWEEAAELWRSNAECFEKELNGDD